MIVLSGALAAWLIPSAPKDRLNGESSSEDKFRSIDFAGAFLLAATITSSLLAVEVGGQKLPWNSPLIVILFATAIVCAALFYMTEKFWAPEPIFPLQLLSHKEVMLGYLVLLLQSAAQLSVRFEISPRPWSKYANIVVVDVLRTALFSSHRKRDLQGGWGSSHACSCWQCGGWFNLRCCHKEVRSLVLTYSGVIRFRTGRYKILAVGATLVAATCYATLIVRWRGKISVWESLEIVPGFEQTIALD